MALRDPSNAHYQLSRAALRNAYGSRRIDASAPQSAKDSTPLGRQRYLQGQGASETGAINQVQNEFKANFPIQIEAQPNAVPQPRMLNRQMIQQPIQNPIAKEPLPFDQAPLGAAFQPVSFGLLPQTQPAEDMSQFIPSTTGPLSNFNLPKFRTMQRTSSIYG